MKRIIGFIICTLLITTSGFSVIGYSNILNHISLKMDSDFEYTKSKQSELGDRETINVWTNMSPSFVNGILDSREFVVMAYDSGADRTILFGGINQHGPKIFTDTWAYNYNTNTWVNMSPGYSGGTLSYRSTGSPGFAYDPDADRTILFGGHDNFAEYNDTWAYNYHTNTWVNKSPTLSGGILTPRGGPRIAYYDSVDRMIMFGGRKATIVYNDTWEYNYNTNTWTNLSPTVVGGRLPKVIYHRMVYDSSAERTILFGGQDDINLQLNDTWMYNYTDNTWYKVSYNVVGGDLYCREAMGFAYDSSSDKSIMACGWAKNPVDEVNDTWVFTYNINLENNQAPNTPEQPSGPNYMNTGESEKYTTNTTDPDGDQVQYQFDWDANGSHDYSIWTSFVKSGSEASLFHSWSVGGTYIVKARARDIYGNVSGWSKGLTVVVNSAPNSPSDPEPEDGATDVDINADLSWDCSDPEGDNLLYDVYFEADDPTPDTLVSSKQTEKWYDPGTMNYSTMYYWQIVAWDEYLASTEGPIWSFTTGSDPNNPPNIPSNPSPEDNATEVDVEANLSWECDDPDGDNVTYDVYLDTFDPPEERVSDDQAETTFDPGTLNFETTYYWQIIVKDEHGASTTGMIWQFTTRENNPPDATTIDGPNKGRPKTSYEFGFTSFDPDEDDIAEYIINWGDNSGEEIIIGPFASGEEARASHSWDERGTYTIEAMAKDVYGAKGTRGFLVVSIPRTRASSNLRYQWFLERFPILNRLIYLIK